MSKKLYQVTCQGMTTTLLNTRTAHGVAYVIAETPDQAYQILRSYLDTNDLGFRHERELKKIELFAEDVPYPACGYKLFV